MPEDTKRQVSARRPVAGVRAPRHLFRVPGGPPGRIRGELRLWLPAVLWGACIWLIGGSSDVPSPPITFFGIDKVAHFGLYGLLAVLIARATRRGASRFRPYVPLLLAVALGAADELRQLSVVSRSGDPYDFVADVAGISVGFMVARRTIARTDRS